ncbi:MAG: helix-turn-helix domain-containing protein [Elusimicrobia bacterium]|nr:helix-turn-helix domain-containing protein [Elusimicrobiota bacterium]
MADEKEFYSVPEFAKKLGISRIAVFKRVKKGRIQAIRIGRNWAIPSDALTPLLDAKKPLRENTMKALTAVKNGGDGENAEAGSMDDIGWD